MLISIPTSATHNYALHLVDTNRNFNLPCSDSYDLSSSFLLDSQLQVFNLYHLFTAFTSSPPSLPSLNSRPVMTMASRTHLRLPWSSIPSSYPFSKTILSLEPTLCLFYDCIHRAKHGRRKHTTMLWIHEFKFMIANFKWSLNANQQSNYISLVYSLSHLLRWLSPLFLNLYVPSPNLTLSWQPCFLLHQKCVSKRTPTSTCSP